MARGKMSKVATDNENGARKAILEDLFFDFHSSRKQVYWFNFVRGVFFGIGSIVGGTLVLALVLWILGFLVGIPGGIGDFIQYIVDTVKERQ
jgi:hypothetical protein